MSAGGTRQALTEEQRQQIIAKLLSERRSQQAAHASSRQQTELPQEERAARLHQLLSKRAAEKQQQDQQSPWPTQPTQHQQQHRQGYQPQQQQQPPHQDWQQPQQVHAQQPRQQYKQQPQRHQAPTSSDSEQGGFRDPLLSPGSTGSVLSNISAVAAGAGASHRQTQHKHLHHDHERQHQQQQHHHQQQQRHQQQQQQPALRPRQPSQQTPGSSNPVLKPSIPRGCTASLRHSPQPPQQQQRANPSAVAPGRQQTNTKPSAVGHSVLSRVLDGPVDISDLWASRASLSGLPDSPDDSQGSGCSQEDSQSSAGYSQSSARAYTRGAGHTGSTLSDSHGSFDSELAGITFGSDDEADVSGKWGLSGSLGAAAGGQQQLHRQPQGRTQQIQRPAASQQQRQAQQFHRPSPPSRAKQQQPQQQPQQQQPFHCRSSDIQPLPASYPDSRAERMEQLSQPKATHRQKYDRMKAEAEQHMLQQCSFVPKTGRGPAHRCNPHGSASERLYKAAAERKARLEQKAAAHVDADVQGCTFQPQTNSAANARVLESYEYVPLHKRLGQVMRSRSEKLAHIQLQVEEEVSGAATFAPRINPRSSMLASLRCSRSCSRVRGGEGPGGGGAGKGWGGVAAPISSPRDAADRDGGDTRDVSRGRSRERCASARSRRTWSEAGQSRGRSQVRPEESACTFSPSINARSELLLQASGEIPLSFLQRQEYFDRLAKEKKQLLQLAVEDAHCSFSPARGSSRGRHSDRGGSLDQEETFLDRIQQLAYADKRRMEASRSALAEHVHATECTFAPAINPRSARMARATPLQELYENSKGCMRRDSVALALELQEQSACTFTPNLRKPGPCGTPPAESRLNLSAEEVAGVVDRLYTDPRDKAARVGEAASYQQYQELKACTFKPEINREVPKQQGPVLVRGLGRFLELKDMARQQAEAKAALEAKVFLTQPKDPQAPFTTPQPFKLGPCVPSGYEGRRRRAVQEAEAAVMGECTFQPRINTHHRSRQQRVAELLARN